MNKTQIVAAFAEKAGITKVDASKLLHGLDAGFRSFQCGHTFCAYSHNVFGEAGKTRKVLLAGISGPACPHGSP